MVKLDYSLHDAGEYLGWGNENDRYNSSLISVNRIPWNIPMFNLFGFKNMLMRRAGVCVWPYQYEVMTWKIFSTLPTLLWGKNTGHWLVPGNKAPVMHNFDLSFAVHWTNVWTNSRIVDDLRRHHAHGMSYCNKEPFIAFSILRVYSDIECKIYIYHWQGVTQMKARVTENILCSHQFIPW